MKANTQREAPKFQPLTVTITLETPDEVQAFYAVANFSRKVSRVVSDATTDPIAGRVPVPHRDIERVLFGIWDQLNNFGIHSGAGGAGVAS